MSRIVDPILLDSSSSDDPDEVLEGNNHHSSSSRRNNNGKKSSSIDESYVKAKLKKLYSIPTLPTQAFQIMEQGFQRQLSYHTEMELKFNTGVYYSGVTPMMMKAQTAKKDSNHNSLLHQQEHQLQRDPDLEENFFIPQEGEGGRGVMIKQEKVYESKSKNQFNDEDDSEETELELKKKKLDEWKRREQRRSLFSKNHIQLSLYNAVSDERQNFLDKIDALYLSSGTTTETNKSSTSSSSTSPVRPIWYYAEGDFIYDQNGTNLFRNFDDRDLPRTQQELQLYRKAVQMITEEPAKYLPVLRYTFSILYWRNERKLVYCQLNMLPAVTCARMSYATLGFTHINHLVHLSGTVVRISTSVSVCTQMTYACASCGMTQVLPVLNGILNFPGNCVTKGCNYARFIPKVNGMNEASRTLCDSVQYAKLQEDSSSAKGSSSNSNNNNNNNSNAGSGDPSHFVLNLAATSDETNNGGNGALTGEDDVVVGGAGAANGKNSSSMMSSFMFSSSNNNNNNNSSSSNNNNSNNNTGGRSLIEISLKGRFRNALSPGDNVAVVGILTSRKLEAGGKGTKAAQLLSCEVYGLKIVKASSAGLSLSNTNTSSSSSTSKSNKNSNDENSNENTSANSIQRSRLTSKVSSNLSPHAILNGQDLLPLLLKKFCPSIYGHVKTKAALLLALVGGTRKPFPEAPRSHLHVLLIGDAGLGKSQLLRAAWQASRRGVFVTANSTSSCGLTVTISRTSGGPGGGGDSTTCEAGAVMYGDGGVTCIDEIDKGHASEQKALLEVMEQQTVSIAKAGVVFSMPIKTSVIAAGNPRSGRFDGTKSYAENVGLSSALVSRFDFVLLLQDGVGDPSNANGSRTGGNTPSHFQQGMPKLSEMMSPLRALYPDHLCLMPWIEKEVNALLGQFQSQMGRPNDLPNYGLLPHEEEAILKKCTREYSTSVNNNNHSSSLLTSNSSTSASSISQYILQAHQPAGRNNNNNNSQNQQRFSSTTTSHFGNSSSDNDSQHNHQQKQQDLSTLLPGVDVRTIIEYCQSHFRPYLCQEAQQVLLHAYLNARRRYFATGTTDSAEITPRYLQSLIRATEARAKFAQRVEATADDAEFAVLLLDSCRTMANTHNENNYNTMMMTTGGGGGGGVGLRLAQSEMTVAGKAKKLPQDQLLMNALKQNSQSRQNAETGKTQYFISKKFAEKISNEVIMNGKGEMLLGRLNESGALLTKGTEFEIKG